MWFPTALGFFKLTQVALNWVAEGAYAGVAQGMMAFQLGGAAFAHTIAEKPDGKPLLAKNAPVAMFFCTTVAIKALSGESILTTVLLHAALAAAGFASGYAILAMGPGGAAEAMSPVKWKKKRGFD